MQKGISYQGFLPIRKTPSEQADMFSQLLFGECFTISEEQGAWIAIRTDSDSSEGWVARESIQLMKEAENTGNRPETDTRMVIHPSVSILDTLNARPMLLPAGSLLHGQDSKIGSGDGARFKRLTDEGWIIPAENSDPEAIGEMLVSIPRLRGGRSGFGFDAPGLVQLLCKSMGISLPHSIIGQAESGSIINFIHEAEKGDLAFFNEGEDQFTHVGMVLGKGKIIHVSDQVRIDKLDQQGIYCAEKKRYTHQLRVVKSVKSVKSSSL